MKLRGLFFGVASGVAVWFGVPKNADATLIISLEQVGSNVVETGTGSVNTTGLTFIVAASFKADAMAPEIAFITGGIGGVDVYEGLSGPASFGPGNGGNENSSTQSGQAFGFDAGLIFPLEDIFVPPGYASGGAINGGAVWNGTTLAALGVTDGVYTWTWGSGANADSLILYAGVPVPSSVPEPASLAIFGAGLAALGVMRRKRMAR